MAFLTHHSLLPKKRLEQDLKVSLASVIDDKFGALRELRPRAYEDLFSYSLNPFEFPVQQRFQQKQGNFQNKQQNQIFTNAPLYWQRLMLANGQTCSELVIMSWQSAIYISYLNVLPDTFGLFSPLDPKKSMLYVNSLITETLNNIVGVTMTSAKIGMVTTLINPNLAVMFKLQGFKEDPAGPEIVGLPLPARFYRSLLAETF